MTRYDRPRWGYLIVWEFRPKKGVEMAFEDAYGPKGIWARLFQHGEGFVATELNHDLKDPGRYLTLDFWTSKQAYEAFRAAHVAEYQAIDEQCESLTEREKEIGTFQRLGS